MNKMQYFISCLTLMLHINNKIMKKSSNIIVNFNSLQNKGMKMMNNGKKIIN